METSFSPTPNYKAFVPLLGAMAVVFVGLTLLAGLPTGDGMIPFVFGILTLIVFTTLLGLASWHLLLRPMPADAKLTTRITISPLTRSIIALLLTLSTLSIGVAGVWDEIWHVRYGIPFGEDFFWRPHIMLYFSFLSVIGLGVWSWNKLMRQGKGTLQQRFRSNPLLGVSFFSGVYTIYAVGADPIWHKLYGRDLSTWSVPHLLILILILTMALLAATYHKTLLPNRTWGFKLDVSWRDALILVVWTGALIDFLLIFTLQWYGANSNARQLEQVTGYPDWLFPAFITFLAALFGTFALHSTRRVGSATLVGLMAIGIRFALDNGFGSVRIGTTPMGIILPLMIALDIVYAIAIARTGKPPVYWMVAVVMALLIGTAGTPLMVSLFPFLPVDVSYLPARIIASLITGAATVWFVQAISEWGGYGRAEDEVAVSSSNTSSILSAPWLNPAIYTTFTVGLLLFILTATPPV